MAESNELPSRRARILGIAPYEGMKTIMQKLAQERDDIQLDVFVGDLHQGLEIARRNYQSNYDVIISRGGTAELIEQEVHTPVVEVVLSVYDLLRAIKLAENYTDRYAIVGFPSITANAHILCDLLRYRIDIFTIHSQDEVQEMLKSLKKEGYRMILCDMVATTTARRMGLNAILITSGAESISSAFDQAVKLSTTYDDIQSEKQFYREIVENGNDQILVLGQEGEVFYSTLEEERQTALLPVLSRELSSVLSQKVHKFFKNLDGTLYSFTARKLSFQGKDYGVFYFSSTSIPFATSKYGIQYSNQQEAEDRFFNSFYSITSSAMDIETSIEHINQANAPIMLSGEAGSGKEQVARIIYSTSALSGNPLITINCALINDRSWNFLTNHYSSPFNDNNNTLYFKDISLLPENRRRHLLSIIMDTNLSRRNRLIFSCSCPLGKGIPPEAMEFVNELSCLTLHLPPLRERSGEIPALSSLYLNTINVTMANQIIGFEPGAMELLQHFDWPYNYTQFKRILGELALVTTTPYIQTEHVAALLDKETSSSLSAPVLSSGNALSSPGTHALDLSRPLADITRDIIQAVLNDCGGNQSAAARQLEIGRSTLWRYLK